jgi:hypothetical protein
VKADTIVPAAMVGDRPSDWIPEGGRPVRGLPHEGMPAYETRGKGVVFESLLVLHTTDEHGRVCRQYLPLRYAELAGWFPTGFVTLHEQPGARRAYRPVAYFERLSDEETPKPGTRDVVRQGSQMELGYRYRFVYDHVDGRWERAERKALELLRSELNPQQRLELAARRAFGVWGDPELLDVGRHGIRYWIQLGNGFTWICPWTGIVQVSFCFHPDEWIPDADVALATKLLIESGPEGEIEILKAARQYPRRGVQPKLRQTHVEAHAIELALATSCAHGCVSDSAFTRPRYGAQLVTVRPTSPRPKEYANGDPVGDEWQGWNPITVYADELEVVDGG